MKVNFNKINIIKFLSILQLTLIFICCNSEPSKKKISEEITKDIKVKHNSSINYLKETNSIFSQLVTMEKYLLKENIQLKEIQFI